MEQTLTHHMVDDIAPQDEAMDQFRRMFKLVAGCEVSTDGMRMTYQMQTTAGAARWSGEARQIITANQLPLKVGIREVKKGGVTEKVELRIVYNPK